MKITKSAFLGQNSGRTWGGQANFWGSGGDPPTRGNPAKKNRGPNMDHCGTVALTGNQFDDCPLSIMHWNLLLRKLLISARASPEIPTCLNL